jgi:hypothetical protein
MQLTCFTAVDGCVTQMPHQIRSTNTKEYYDTCGFNVGNESRKKWRNEASDKTKSVIDDIRLSKLLFEFPD